MVSSFPISYLLYVRYMLYAMLTCISLLPSASLALRYRRIACQMPQLILVCPHCYHQLRLPFPLACCVIRSISLFVLRSAQKKHRMDMLGFGPSFPLFFFISLYICLYFHFTLCVLISKQKKIGWECSASVLVPLPLFSLISLYISLYLYSSFGFALVSLFSFRSRFQIWLCARIPNDDY